jgi:DnaJ domain
MQGVDDPLSILGLQPGASADEVEKAYRRLAKRWHPDRGGGAGAALRMAEINVAHDLLRAGAQHARSAPRRPAAAPGPTVRRKPAGAWLADPVRRAMGAELLQALEDREPVIIVTPTSLWKSPRAVLAVTDRRLLWLLDDAPVARVRSLLFREVAAVGLRVHRPRRRAATLSLRTIAGRRLSFAELRPQTAETIERHLLDAL